MKAKPISSVQSSAVGPRSAATTQRLAAETAQPSQLALQSWLSVVRAYNLCDAVMTQRLGALGLHLAEHEVLVNLLRESGITQQQLAQRCFVAKSGVSMLVSRMEAAGLVRREASAQDARAWLLSLTAKGAKLAHKAHAVQNEVLLAMVAPHSDDDLVRIGEAMNQTSETLTALRDSFVK